MRSSGRFKRAVMEPASSSTIVKNGENIILLTILKTRTTMEAAAVMGCDTMKVAVAVDFRFHFISLLFFSYTNSF